MSHILSCILISNLVRRADPNWHEDPILPELNRQLAEAAKDMGMGSGGFQVVPDTPKGKRPLQLSLWQAAFNYFSMSRLVAILKRQAWEEGEVVQLLYSNEHDEGCGLATIWGTPSCVTLEA